MPLPTHDAAGAGTSSTASPWLSPGTVLALAGATSRVVTLATGVITQILANDAQRVGFTVIRGISLPSMPRLGPDPRVDVFGLRADPDTDVRTFLLQDWSSLIVGEWYAQSVGDGTVLLIEYHPHGY